MRGKSKKMCKVLWYSPAYVHFINPFLHMKIISISIWTLIHFGTLSLDNQTRMSTEEKFSILNSIPAGIFFFPFSYIVIISISSNIYKFSCVYWVPSKTLFLGIEKKSCMLIVSERPCYLVAWPQVLSGPCFWFSIQVDLNPEPLLEWDFKQLWFRHQSERVRVNKWTAICQAQS